MLKCVTCCIICRNYASHLLANIHLIAIFLLCLSTCKPLTSSTTTVDAMPQSYEDLLLTYHQWFHNHQGTIRLNYIQELEQDIITSLAHNVFSKEEQEEIQKMLHKVRSFIIYGKLSGCLEQNEYGHYVQTEKTTQMLCSVILTKMKELDYYQIDLNQPNVEFFHSHNNSKRSEQELFLALHEIILATTVASMRKYLRMFPFADTRVVHLCKAKNTELIYVPIDVTKIPRNDYVTKNPDIVPPSFPATSYPQRQQKNNNCQQLATELQQESTPQQNEKIFATSADLQVRVNNYVLRLNATIDRLDRLIHGADGEKPATKKENIFIFQIANVVDFNNNNVINAYDEYTKILLEAARAGILPLMMLYYQDKLHLNIKGGWGGLKAMQYTPLEYPLSRKLEEVIAFLHEHLVTRWLSLKEDMARGKEEKDKKIYELLVNNDIAVTRLIMQDPTYSLPVTRLFDKYQDKNRAPKWLQVFKSWTYRLDMLFIPLMFAAGFISGGAAFPLVATIAVSINFFWVGVTSVETHLARKRYALMERALLSGNSMQVKRGAKLLREFHNKRRSLVVAGVVGAPMSIPSLKMAIQSIHGLKVAVIDTSAAFASDADGLIDSGDLDFFGRFDDQSDAELLQEH